MKFPNLQFESVVQVNDKTRLNAVNSYVSKDEAALTIVEIEPEAGAGFINVFNANSKNWFLDYQYSTDGTKVVSVRIDNGGGSETATFSLEVLSVANDKLFSDDHDLMNIRNDILKYLPEERNSFLNFHRKAQELIVAFLDEKGITDVEGNKLTKADIVDVSEVKQWSIYLTLHLIFHDLSNVVDDIFDRYSKKYYSDMLNHRNRAFLRLDLNNDGTIDLGEGSNFHSIGLYRR